MNAEALDYALQQAHAPATPRPSPAQPMGAAMATAVEDCALALAHQHRLIDRHGQLHCWNCGGPIGWHVSLHCPLCRAEAIRQAPERRRQEWLACRREREREQEQSRPVQRASRQFRDED